jgi:hypothetical protein
MGLFSAVTATSASPSMIDTWRLRWDSWNDDDITADLASGQFLARSDAGAFHTAGTQFPIAGRFTVAPSPHGCPVMATEHRWQPSDEGSEYRPVGPVHVWSWVGSAEHGDLMT